jgi:hypothetical protein
MGQSSDDGAFPAIVGHRLRARWSAAEAVGHMEVLEAQPKQHVRASPRLLRLSRQALDGVRSEKQTGG